MRFAQETFEIPQAAIGGIDSAIIGNVIAVVAQRRGIEWHDPDRGRAEILDVIELLREASEIADAVIVGIEIGFHMQLIDYRVAIPLQVVAIDHAAGLQSAAASRLCWQIPERRIRLAASMLRAPVELRHKIGKTSAAPPDKISHFTMSFRTVPLFPKLGPIVKARAQVALEAPVHWPVKCLAPQRFRPVILP